MLQLSNSFINKKILSLHNGAVIGRADQPLINPENLKIEGWFSVNNLLNEECIVLVQDVREYTRDGIIVDSHDALTRTEDLVRLKKTIEIRFELIGKKVSTENKSKLGTVGDYAVSSDTMYIQKLYVDPPLIKTFGVGHEQKIIDRTSIVEITNAEIVVKDSSVKAENRAIAPASA